MRTISKYHRPDTYEDALALLARTEVATRLLAGGTVVNAENIADEVELVDLQAVGSTSIDAGDGRSTIGALATLQDITGSGSVPPILGELAAREASSTLRNAATIGGTIATRDPDSALLAGLLVHHALVTLRGRSGEQTVPLPDLLGGDEFPAGQIIESVTIETSGSAAVAVTSRTPADLPIVAAVGRSYDGRTALALTGVASVPVLVDPDDLSRLDPVGDFRGSPEYRLHLAGVLTRRVLAELGGGR